MCPGACPIEYILQGSSTQHSLTLEALLDTSGPIQKIQISEAGYDRQCVTDNGERHDRDLVSGYPEIRISGYPEIQKSGYPDMRMFGNPDKSNFDELARKWPFCYHNPSSINGKSRCDTITNLHNLSARLREPSSDVISASFRSSGNLFESF